MRQGPILHALAEDVREFAADGLFTAYTDEPNWAKAHGHPGGAADAPGTMRTFRRRCCAPPSA
ncbi:hypothetical protein SALBM311S_00013 [Streptomyces alboniger]